MDIVRDVEESTRSASPARLPDHPVDRPLCKRVFRSEDLLGRERKVIILHGGEEYVLQVTKSGKLLLTK